MSFSLEHYLSPGDVVIVPKSELNIIAHYLVFKGRDIFGREYWIENAFGIGVRNISHEQFYQINKTVKRIRRFEGNDYARSGVIQRAESLLGSSYDLESFNCEHFANYAQYGVSKSNQTDNVKAALGIAGVALLAFGIASLFSKSEGKA